MALRTRTAARRRLQPTATVRPQLPETGGTPGSGDGGLPLRWLSRQAR